MSGENGIPDGWSQAMISDAVVPQQNRNPKQSGSGSFQYVDIDALDNTVQRITSPKTVQNDKAPSRARRSIRNGDVIFSLVRPYLKNAAIVPEELDDQIASTAYCVLRPASGIASSFLFFKVVQDSFILSLPTYGSSPPAARDDEFLSMELQIPPESEQARIVAKIEELFSDLDAGVAALERAKANLKRYRAAVLKAAVEGKLTEQWRAENLDVEPASELLERILAERRERWEAGQLAKYEEKGKKPPTGWKEKYKEPAEPDC